MFIRHRLALVLTTCVALHGTAFADPTPAPVRAEIDAMLGRLEASGCRFLRNGSWHDGARAREHLLDKLEYIEKRGTLQNAEQFIELAASRSSLSGPRLSGGLRGSGAGVQPAMATEQLGRVREGRP